MLQVAALISNVQDSINDLRACWEVQDNEISCLTKTLASKQSSNICFKETFCLLENLAHIILLLKSSLNGFLNQLLEVRTKSVVEYHRHIYC